MSVPALAIGARALARIPVLFSTSFRHRTIFFTVTAIFTPPYCPKNLMAQSYCGLTWSASYPTELTRSPDFIRRMKEWRGAFLERGDLYRTPPGGEPPQAVDLTTGHSIKSPGYRLASTS